MIFFTATTIPRWWSGKSKCESFIFIVFNCLAKALMRHMNNVGETSRALFVLQTTCKTLFSNQSRNHTTGCLDINCCPCNNSLFETYTFCCHTTLEAPTVSMDNVSALQIHLLPTFHLLKHKLLRANQKFLCSFALEKVLFCFVLKLLTRGVARVPFSKM